MTTDRTCDAPGNLPTANDECLSSSFFRKAISCNETRQTAIAVHCRDVPIAEIMFVHSFQVDEVDTGEALTSLRNPSEMHLQLVEKIKSLENELISAQKSNEALVQAAQDRTERARVDVDKLKVRIVEEENKAIRAISYKTEQQKRLRAAAETIGSLRRENQKLKRTMADLQDKASNRTRINQAILGGLTTKSKEVDRLSDEQVLVTNTNDTMRHKLSEAKDFNKHLHKELSVHQDSYWEKQKAGWDTNEHWPW